MTGSPHRGCNNPDVDNLEGELHHASQIFARHGGHFNSAARKWKAIESRPPKAISTWLRSAPWNVQGECWPRCAGQDVLDQIRFAADQGFTAREDNGMAKRPVEEQEKIGSLLEALGMQMGVFVAYANFDRPTFAKPTDADRDEILVAMRAAKEVAKRCRAKWCTVVPGSVNQQHPESGEWNKYGGPRLAEGYQTTNVIEMLRRCVDIVEHDGPIIVLEPLNWHANHGGTFLQRSDQAYALCKAVNSPRCKILFDIYHQQITEGNLIPNIDACWDEIAYMQSGDNPGRKEPGTGEINYRKVFSHIHAKGYRGVIGMEHGNSQKGKPGEQAVIDAYRAADDF